MRREFNRANLRGIYRMLTEWAKVNFAYQIKRSHHQDELEGLVAYFNQTGEELNNNRNQFLWLNRQNEIMVIRTAIFLLNDNLEVIDYSYKHPDNKIIPSNKILGKPFKTLLEKKTQSQWQDRIKAFKKDRAQSFNIMLEYQFDESLKLNLNSVVSRLMENVESSFIVISFLLDTSKDYFPKLPKNAEIKTFSKWDQKLFHEIHIYIIHHLDEPSKSLDELAELFNTNEYKIKTGFKEIFGCTPFQYHADQRIKHCKILIENTDLSLTEISIKMGFASYPHFSKNFKEKTKMSPRNYKKIIRNS